MTDRNSEDKQIKVTDKRMFTADGELREEFKDLKKVATPTDSPAAPTSSPPPAASAASALPPETTKKPEPEPQEYPSGAQFEDLVALLAQTTVTFLQQASSPRARTENLEQAQLYLDLLGILDEKTHGNLAKSEKAMLEDALRQLRLAFAQRG